MSLNENFRNIVTQLKDDHYCDNEVYYAEVLKEPYEIFLYKNFALIVAYQVLPGGFRVGYSRGGIRFNPEGVTIEEFKFAYEDIYKQLSQKNYLYIIIDHLKPASEFTSLQGEELGNKKKGTAVIYPKEDWVSKFKSKERYNLTYAGKKGVEIEIFSGSEFDKIDYYAFETLHQKSIIKARGHYFMPGIDKIKNLAANMDCLIALARFKEKYIAFNISIYNPSKTRLERVFAGSDKNYASIRAPEYLEIKFIEHLHNIGINYYDLWMLNEGDGYTAFKEKLADEIINFAPRSVWYINKIAGKPYFWLSKLKEKLLN